MTSTHNCSIPKKERPPPPKARAAFASHLSALCAIMMTSLTVTSAKSAHEKQAKALARTVDTPEQREFLANALLKRASEIQDEVVKALRQSLGSVENQKPLLPNTVRGSVEFNLKGIHEKGAMATVFVTLAGVGPEFEHADKVAYDLSVKVMIRPQPGMPTGELLDVPIIPNPRDKGRPSVLAVQISGVINSEIARRLQNLR